MFPAICWHVKRHTKWHLGVNFHDPDSTSQQDRLHFQFYSSVYKRESFCRKWELIQIFTLKSNGSFIDQKAKKKKRKGCISLEYSVPRDTPSAKPAWNRSRAATSMGKPMSREGQAMPGRPNFLLRAHLQLVCNLHTFSSLPAIWLAASLPAAPLRATRDHIWPDADKRPRGFSKVWMELGASLLLKVPGNWCPRCPSGAMGQREALAFGWWTPHKRVVQGHGATGHSSGVPSQSQAGIGTSSHCPGQAKAQILLLGMARAGCHFEKSNLIALFLHLLAHLWFCSAYLHCQPSRDTLGISPAEAAWPGVSGWV